MNGKYKGAGRVCRVPWKPNLAAALASGHNYPKKTASEGKISFSGGKETKTSENWNLTLYFYSR